MPPDLPTASVNNDANTTFEYTYDNTAKTYCITATFQKVSYYVSNTVPNPTAGLCAGHTGGAPIADGVIIQTVTSGNCLATRIRAVDARDSHTYWVQKLADGKCWMLTNLAYAGSGVNTYGDVKTLTVNPGATYTTAGYFIPGGANPTTEPTQPSASTNGIGQYGYLYNWCGAMGGQATAACANATTPTPDTTISICPSGWRLPTGNGGEFGALNTAVNGGSNSSDAGLLASPWLGQLGGDSSGGSQGVLGRYWSSTQNSTNVAYNLIFDSSSSFPACSDTQELWAYGAVRGELDLRTGRKVHSLDALTRCASLARPCAMSA